MGVQGYWTYELSTCDDRVKKISSINGERGIESVSGSKGFWCLRIWGN